MTTLNLSQKNRSRATPRVAFGDVRYDPGGSCGPRIQRDFQLVVIYAGDARIDVAATELCLPAQHVTLLLPDRREFFRFSATQPTHHSWCAITPTAVPPLFQERLRYLPTCLPLSQRMHELIELGMAVPVGNPAADELVESIGLALLHAYCVDAIGADSAQRSTIVRQTQQYMDLHLSQPLDLAGIAAAANVSPQHLTRLFQRDLHCTPMRYLWQQRTERGVTLLRETGLSVAEIAERVGFQSPFHFSRLVRQRYNLPPRGLRNQLWSQNRA